MAGNQPRNHDHGSARWTPTQHARNGEVDVAVRPPRGFGRRCPCCSIMGLGTSRFWWPSRPGAGVRGPRGSPWPATTSATPASRPGCPTPPGRNPFTALFGRKGGAYTAEDMTDDAIAVMDELGWSAPHSSAHSLGGVCAAHRPATPRPGAQPSCPPRRCRATSPALGSRATCASACWRSSRGPGSPRAARATFRRSSRSPAGSPRPPTRSTNTPSREWIEREADSGPRDTKAQSRQIGAQWHGPALSDPAQADARPARRGRPAAARQGRQGHRQRRRRRPAGHVPRRRSRHPGPAVARRRTGGA